MGDNPTNPTPRDRPPSQRRQGSLPARLLGTGARGARRVAEATGIDDAVELVTEETIVRTVESEAFEHALERVLAGPVVEEAVERALQSPAVERALTDALDSQMVDRVWERLLASDEAQKLVERIAEAPEVRAAVAAQSVGLIGDLGRGARRVARRLDDGFESVVRRLFFRPRRVDPTDRAGAVTRLLAFAVDAAILNAGFLAVSALVALVVSALFGSSDEADASVIVIGSGLWLTAGSAYLLFFWSLAGQTPGMRFIGIRLDSGGERRIGLRCALRRLFGLALAVIPLGLGLVGVLGDRRQGWQDRIAGTEVLYAGIAPPAAPWSEFVEPRQA
jgi:uncharacterized RDD family membrane protein YckC